MVTLVGHEVRRTCFFGAARTFDNMNRRERGTGSLGRGTMVERKDTPLCYTTAKRWDEASLHEYRIGMQRNPNR